MTRLAWWLIRAQFLARRTATALSMLTIALGVSLGYAIHLINEAALADFSQAMKSVQGEPDAVLAPRDSAGGVPLALINEIARDESVAIVAPVIETRVRPAVANDGGDIRYRGFRDGVVYLQMQGACSGCPSSTATLKHGIEGLLKHYVPEVTEVRAA